MNTNRYFLIAYIATGAIVPNVNAQDSANDEAAMDVIQVLATRPQGIHISSEQITTMPGGLGDPLKAIDALPGVILALPANGSPIAQPAIRGSSPGDNQFESDFLPVGYVFHREGISIFNPMLLKNFDLKTSSWSGQYNDAIGGVISTELRDPSIDEWGMTLDLSQIRSGVMVESPLADNMAFYASYRESLVHHFIDDIVEDEDFIFSTPPRNHDYQGKFLWEINNNNTLRLIATGAEDLARIEFKENAKEVARNPDLAAGEGFTAKYDNWGLILDNDSAIGETKIALSMLDTSTEINEGLVEQSLSENKETLFKWRTLTDTAYGSFVWGGHYRQQSLLNRNKSRLVNCVAEFGNCQSSSLYPIVEDEMKVDVNSASLFADWNIPINVNWDAGITLVVSNNDFTDQNMFEPRMWANYALSDTQNLRFSAGQYHQWFRNVNLISSVFGNPNLSLSEATMFGAAYEQAMQNGWNWKVDLYYKQLNNLAVATTDGYSDTGEGKAWGAEFMLNKALTDNWYGWVSLAYTKSERNNSLTNETINYEFDIPLIGSLVAKYQWNDNWHIGFKWSYQSGKRYTDIVGATPVFSNADTTDSDQPLFYQPIYGEFNGLRRDAGHRLDIRVDYLTQVYGVPVNVYLDVLNILGAQSIQEDEWNADYTESTPDYAFPDEMFPGLGISIHF